MITTLQIRPLELYELKELKNFTPPNWSGTIIDTYQFHFGKPYFHPFVAEIKSCIVGCGFGLINENSGWLSSLVVLPEYRGQGIGTKLVEERMQYMKSFGCVRFSAFTASPASTAIYTKLGFIEQSTYTLLKRNRTIIDRLLTRLLREYRVNFIKVFPGSIRKQFSWRSTPNVRKAKINDSQTILAIDQKISGEHRKKFLEQFLSKGWVYHDKDQQKIKGFYLEGFGNIPIHALDPQSGLELLQFKIGRGSENICVPSENKVAIEFLVNAGFRITEIQPRMTLGPIIDWKPKGIFNRGGGTG